MAVPVAEVAALARAIGLEIPPQYLEGVATQLAALQMQAQLVMDLNLEGTSEPARDLRP